jgi:hypothetical protein
MMWGYHDISTPSRFLRDIPPDITEGRTGLAQPPAEHPLYSPQSQWDTTWEARRLAATPPPNFDIPDVSDKPIYENRSGGSKKSNDLPSGSAKPRFKSGQRVFHLKFGEGVVIKSKIHQDVEEVEVLFIQQPSAKRIDANFLQPFIGEDDRHND